MSALSTFVDEILSDLSAFGIKQGRTAWLSSSVTSTSSMFTVEATDSIAEGVAEIGTEQVYVKGFDSQSNVATIAPDGRGWNGTTAAAHTTNSRMTLEPRFPRKNVEAAINRTIARSFPTIWATARVNLTVNASVATYALPSTTQAVSMVTTETFGPSGMWIPITDHTFDGHADTTAYPTGKTVTIPGGIWPGRTVQVTIRKTPSALTSLSLDFTDSGLQDSAKAAIRLGTLADLLRTSDPVRLSSHSASADEFDTKRGYGTATKIANDLETQFIRELDAERSRLRALYPATIHRKQMY